MSVDNGDGLAAASKLPLRNDDSDEDATQAGAKIMKWEPTGKAVDDKLKSAGAGHKTLACFGAEILVGSAKPAVKVYQVGDGKVVESRKLVHGSVGANCVETGAEHFASICYHDGAIGLWDLRQSNRALGLESTVANAQFARFVPLNSHMLVSGGASGCLAFWDLRMPRLVDEIVPDMGHGVKRTKSPSETVESKAKRMRTEPAAPASIASLALSSDGQLLACGRSSGEISVVRLQADGSSGQFVPAGDVQAHHSHARQTFVRGLAFDTQSRMLLSGGDDNHVNVFDASSWARHTTNGRGMWFDGERFSAHKRWISSLSVCPSPSHRVALTTSLDGTVKLWDYGTQECLRTYTEHSDKVLSSAFSSGSSSLLYFATGGADAQLVVYTPVSE